MRRAVVLGLLSLCVLYLGDYASVRFRLPNNRDPYGNVQVRRYYAVRQKNKTTEFYFDPPENMVCVQSLFPQLGHEPCWYTRRNTVRRKDV